MTIEEMAEMFESISNGDSPKVGYHLHDDMWKLINIFGSAKDVSRVLYSFYSADKPDYPTKPRKS